MEYTLTRHKMDAEMIEAVCFTEHFGGSAFLAFVIHSDMLDDELKKLIDRDGSINVEMSMI